MDKYPRFSTTEFFGHLFSAKAYLQLNEGKINQELEKYIEKVINEDDKVERDQKSSVIDSLKTRLNAEFSKEDQYPGLNAAAEFYDEEEGEYEEGEYEEGEYEEEIEEEES